MGIRPLPAAALQALDVLYQHRLVSTSQMREIVLPGRSIRWTQQVLAELAARGLAGSVAAQAPWPVPGERVWYITERGALLAEAAPSWTETPARLLTPELASGRLQKHTLAVNDVGISFLRSARERGHDFGPESWRHEVAHDLRTSPRQPHDLLIADAVLRYWMVSQTERATLRYRLLELDRATRMMDDLAAKLARYARLHQRWTEHRAAVAAGDLTRPAWALQYRAFPRVMVVLANRERANLRRRLETVMALCRSDPELVANPEVSISLVLLEELMARGPFAPIFRHLRDDSLVNWLGQQTEEARIQGADSADEAAE